MTTDLILPALDVAMADCLAHHEHFVTFIDGGALCRICSCLWPTDEAWAKDNGYCPGYSTCGYEPVPGAEHRLSVGSVGEEA